MNKIIILMMSFLAFACEANDQMNEKTILEQKVEAFKFLSDYHHQLHIMIGEEEGDIIKAYNEFKSASELQTNIELIPVKEALGRIKGVDPENIDVKQLDYLVDYYQSGLSIQIEAILRGYGYKENFEMNTIMDIYYKLSKGNN
jgi:hypothetical protein|tara:strand:+ start:247 stop:678 length:432 start_codon:yes stop_codon:yes gene_type:complete